MHPSSSIHPSPLLPCQPQVNHQPQIASQGTLSDAEMDRQDARQPWLPKMDFPHFDRADVHIWIDKCAAYFSMYQISICFRVSVASIHMSGFGAQWFQSFKHTPGAY
jgi:hypothetical protein